jgi:hypothetical protein
MESMSLTLKGDGTSVSLSGSPLDPNYKAKYPLGGVDELRVQFLPSGDIAGTCTRNGAAVECDGVPFFAKVIRTAGGASRVQVYDLYGEKVCDHAFEGKDAGTMNMPDGSYTTTSDAGSTTRDAGYTTSTDGDAACDDMGMPHTCDATAVAAAKKQFCDDIDKFLKDHNISYNVDCSKLDDHFDYSQAQPPKDHENIRCLDIIHDGWEKVDAEFKGCAPNVQDTVYNWKSSSRWDLIQHGTCRGSPLVLDLDGDGIRLSSLETGVKFDLLGTGARIETAWTTGRDALLALDRNGDGAINDASELFGESTGGRSFDNGFAALADLDDNGDGRVDRKDAMFSQLRVWVDADHNGVSTPRELSTLGEAGVRSLELSAVRNDGPSSWDKNGNTMPLVSRFVRDDGTLGMFVDAYFRFKP